LIRLAARSRGEDQPDPNGSPGGAAVQAVFDDLGDLQINARKLTDQRSKGLELLEAGDVRIIKGPPNFYG
jgi:hypothetical protein